jgi:hypothetical protein
MEKQNHIFDDLTVIFSHERLDGYLSHAHCNNSKNEALIAYSWNIELSQALYPSLQILEISLRNSLNTSISEHFHTEQWFELPFLYEKEQKKIIKAKKTLEDKRKTLTAGRLVAELSFGFWVSLFDIRYEHNQTLWPKLINPTFPFAPKGQRTRNFLSRELNRIKFLRNRVFHYEPVWHWKDLLDQHNSLIKIIKYISPSASEYLCIFDQLRETYSNGKSQIESRLNKLLTNN